MTVSCNYGFFINKIFLIILITNGTCEPLHTVGPVTITYVGKLKEEFSREKQDLLDLTSSNSFPKDWVEQMYLLYTICNIFAT